MLTDLSEGGIRDNLKKRYNKDGVDFLLFYSVVFIYLKWSVIINLNNDADFVLNL